MIIQANDPEITSLMKISNTITGATLPWQFSAFPDGQVQLKVPKSAVGDFDQFDVKVSLTNPIILDLFMQLLYSASINRIKINYLYGARCDKIESGDYYVCNVAAKVLEDIHDHDGYTRSCDFLAPHCLDLVNEYSNSKSIYTIPDCVDLSDYDMIIFPDESAFTRYAPQIDGMLYMICEKHRDQESGKIISHKIPALPDHVKKVILLDDLGDALGSFINIAKTTPENVSLDLFIFHGVFTNNALQRGLEYFNKIIVSNSLLAPQKQYEALPDEDKSRVVIFDVWD